MEVPSWAHNVAVQNANTVAKNALVPDKVRDAQMDAMDAIVAKVAAVVIETMKQMPSANQMSANFAPSMPSNDVEISAPEWKVDIDISGTQPVHKTPEFVFPTIVAPSASKPVYVRQYSFKKGNKVVKTAACSITGFTPNANDFYKYIPGVESPSEVHIHAQAIRTLGIEEYARRYLELDAILVKNKL